MIITLHLFEAHLKCPTKCWLRAGGEPIPTAINAYAEWVQNQNESYRAATSKRLTVDAAADEYVVAPAAENLKMAKWRLAVDVSVRTELRSRRGNEDQTLSAPSFPVDARLNNQSLLTSAATIVESRLHAVERVPSDSRGKPTQFIPIRFLFTNKLGKDDKLLLAFDAFVLSQAIGREVSFGKIIHGDDHAALKVKTSVIASEVRKRIEKITALLSSPSPPDLVLNRHCAECEFQTRCRQKALETGDLSLLASMSAKERQKLRSKGIFTIMQLSYTFRPRRRPKRLRDKREKYHHSLKALAIREKKIHIIGSPELKIEGTPIYLDVEGLPDRDFYYLIGVRIGNGESVVQHSLWADTVEDEEKNWREFLGILDTVEKPVLIHYGSYETTFLKRMCEKYGAPVPNSPAAKAAVSNVNLLSIIFAQVYFPGFSNGLKDVAGYLGFKWTDVNSSGLQSISWRCQWQRSPDKATQKKLLIYNAEDCEALTIVTDRISQLTGRLNADESSQTSGADVVRADSEEFQKKSKWRHFTSPVEGFEYINAAAHWDYQRHRVYARAGKSPKKAMAPRRGKPRPKRAQLVILWPASWRCPKCKRQGRFKSADTSKTVHDLIFGRQSLKRRVVKYVFRTYHCRKCQIVFGLDDRFRIFRQYGWNLIVYLFYHIVELNIPQRTAVDSFNRLFDFNLRTSTVNHMKERFGRYYAETRQKILEDIIQGQLVHADETRANIKGKIGFVWVLTNMKKVFYTLADSREGDMVQKLLAGFKGVLVSDFYTAYDSIECPQQRCLIHLMRDLNDEVLSNPFDDQLKQIVTAFGILLKPMIETVDRYGLKKHFLKKHLTDVEHFYRELARTDWQSDAALKCNDRFERNRDKLFTFLSFDEVPWNNNNAEHAIKAFARVRDVVAGASTEKGLEDYLTLLSVCQTCKYVGVDFLDFLRSGEKDIHAFAESRHQRRHRTPTNPPTDLLANTIADSGG